MGENNRKELFKQIKLLPGRLKLLVGRLPDAQLDTPYGPDKWTIRQVVNHLADSHINGFSRMKMLLTEENPTLKPYDQDAWAELHDTKSFPINAALETLEGIHTRWFDLLTSLPDEAWQRKGNHPEHGEVTVAGLLEDYANHGEKHLGHISGLLDKKGW